MSHHAANGSLIVLAVVSVACSGHLTYTPPTPAPIASNSVTVNRSRADLWRTLVPQLAKTFFVINNLDQSSGLRAQQDVQGVKLGVTSVRELLSTRRAPDDSGKSNDGWLYVAFGADRPQYLYYFSSEDSVVEWARVFVIDGYAASRVHEAFGRPDTVEYGEDLAKHEEYRSRFVIVTYKPNGDVSYIEYHPGFGRDIGFRRADRAGATIDTLMGQSLSLETVGLSLALAMDSARVFHNAFDLRSGHRLSRSKTPLPRLTLRNAARFDSLCVVVKCDIVARNMRAWDTKP